MVVALVVVWLPAVVGLAAASPGKTTAATKAPQLERVHIFGREYVRLADWARANQLTLRWPKPSPTIHATNRWTHLTLTVDSRRAVINGVVVWLSVPIAAHNGVAYIAPVDLRSAIQPVLNPPRNRPGAKIRTVCLDPGHGGKDPGNLEGRHEEKKYTLLLAKEVARLLKNAGLKVCLTRTTDRFIELDRRPAIAKRNGADLFVSLHFNAVLGADRDAQGVEVYCLTPAYASSTNARGAGADTGASPGNRHDEKNLLLAYQLQKAIVRSLPVEDRGVHRARFGMFRTADMPAALVEGGFMSHPAEARRIYDPAHRRRLAQAIVDGVLAYKRLLER
jgi:N-acetylmuramoyl-L-alanine amidase